MIDIGAITLRDSSRKGQPVAYVSGPYRAPTLNGVYENIHAARTVGLRLWEAGFVAITPHLNSAFMDGWCPDHVWLDGDLELVRRSDLVVMVRGWERSEGARAERQLALDLGLFVFEEHETERLADFLSAWRAVTH